MSKQNTPEENDKEGLGALNQAFNLLQLAALYLAHGSNPTTEQAIKLGSACGRIGELISEFKKVVK